MTRGATLTWKAVLGAGLVALFPIVNSFLGTYGTITLGAIVLAGEDYIRHWLLD